MSSIQRGYAQRLTRKYVVADNNCFGYLLSDISTWKSNNSDIITIVSPTVIQTTNANIQKLLGNVSRVNAKGNTVYGLWNLQSNPILPGIMLTDLGRDIFIGVTDNSNVLHLRMVQLYGTPTVVGTNNVFYIVVEANGDFFSDALNVYPSCNVARV